MKKTIALAVALCCVGLSLSGCGTAEQESEQATEIAEEQGMKGERDGGGRGGNGGGMIDKSGDEELTALLAQTRDKFKQIDYTDDDMGMSFSYNLLEPDSYDESEMYPLVLFITDSSVVGNDTTAALEQGYGALVWATDEEQTKHPSFVIAPEYPENILEGEDGTTDYVQATLNLLDAIQEQYSIDASRLYITGQSMGCMTALYLNGTYPDMFAASIFVDGQWSTDILAPLENQNFFYFAAEGDERASEGMANVMAMFDADGVAYGTARLNAKDDSETIAAGISAVIDEGYNANFISWEEGSVLPDGVESGGMGGEHMYSFDHPYKISTLRDWLFEQSK
ncbi:MAG: hypothetical protein LIO59_01175 [Oscillospiraceae bacterium]|nr:hypothetical protein [Oscillospiraceae bacterium]